MNTQVSPGWLTSEFALTIIKIIVGTLVMAGIVAPQHQDDLTNAFTTVAGAIIMLIPSVSYIVGRTWLKAKTAAPTAASNVTVTPAVTNVTIPQDTVGYIQRNP